MALIQNRHAAADLFYHAHLMGNDDHGNAESLIDIPDQLQDGMGRLRVQGAGGLVTEQNLRISGQSPGNGNSLLLAAGKLGWISICLVWQSYYLQKLHGSFFRVCFIYSRKLQRETDIFQTGSLHQQVKTLKNHGDFPAHLSKLRCGKGTDILAVYEDLAFRGPLQHVDTADQRTLSRSAHTDDSVDIAIPNGQIYIFQSFHGSVRCLKFLGQIFYLYHSFLRTEEAPEQIPGASPVFCLVIPGNCIQRGLLSSVDSHGLHMDS